jgi:hypothetical protein
VACDLRYRRISDVKEPAVKRLAILIYVATHLLSASVVDADPLYTCGEGTVRRVQSFIQTIRDETQQGIQPYSRWALDTSGDAATSFLVTVELKDRAYVAQSSADSRWNFDPRRLLIGQAIAVCTNSSQIVLDRLDGTDYRAKVVRIEPIAGGKAPAAPLSTAANPNPLLSTR